MRGSTAAGINVPQLPRDCSCGEFAGGHLLVVPSGEETFSLAFVRDLPMVLYRKRLLFGVCWISGSAVWERGLFFLAFVGDLPLVLYWKRPLFPAFLAFGVFGIFGIRLIRYRRGPPVVRNMRAVRKKASYGTRRVFGSIRCKKQAFLVQE